jgi:hypothetical protein
MATQLQFRDINSTVNITSLGQEVFGVTFTNLILIQIGMTAFYVVMMVYLWPLYIDVDEERKLRFYYPLTCDYWCPPERP